MTDNEIIKALECCKEAKLQKDCLDLKCPLSTEYGCNFEQEELRNKALDLINRQNEEIEKLSNCVVMQEKLLKENEKRIESVVENIIADEKLKAEAIKEFAERLKELPSVKNCEYEWLHLDIYNLVKEMVGDA